MKNTSPIYFETDWTLAHFKDDIRFKQPSNFIGIYSFLLLEYFDRNSTSEVPIAVRRDSEKTVSKVKHSTVSFLHNYSAIVLRAINQ